MKRFFKSFGPVSTTVGRDSSSIESSSPSLSSIPGPSVALPLPASLQLKSVVPPIPHPNPYDNIAVLPTKSGLLLRPHIDGTPPVSHIRIEWGSPAKVEEVEGDGQCDWDDAAIIYGLVGILELFSGSYLLTITSRSQQGEFLHSARPVYSLTGITVIPLEESKARHAVSAMVAKGSSAQKRAPLPALSPDGHPIPSSELTSRSPTPRVQFADENQIRVISPSQSSMPIPKSPSVDSFISDASSVTSDTDAPLSTLVSRLAFWKSVNRSEPPKLDDDEAELQELHHIDDAICADTQPPAAILSELLSASAPVPESVEERNTQLEEKIIRECIREFTKGGMYFAYTFDITRSTQHKQDLLVKAHRQRILLDDLNVLPAAHVNATATSVGDVNVFDEPYATLPLWRRVDRKFWWNEWLAKPFIDAGLHSYVLPIMQGYFQTASFDIPEEKGAHDAAIITYTIISRRSRDRAGLRYQRRGIDDDANVANFVETETVLHVEASGILLPSIVANVITLLQQREGIDNHFSHVQIRGSIPLFWTQTGAGLKPPPVLSTDRTHAQSLAAMKRHFQRTVPQYGPHVIVNLAEQTGKEGPLAHCYRVGVQELNLPDVQYCEYDFHAETKGMKYENISKLIEIQGRTLESQGYLWISGETLMSTQKSVFRTNCIDCLDRTNVVQSAFARHVMNRQLDGVALANITRQARAEMDIVFNDVWANNGDSISRAYAGTSALKGDFTRTGKRDIGGMLNDGVNSLARMYSSTFSDWFSQAVIDFMLGYRTLSVFSEFLLKLQSTDPRELIHLSRIRAEAIATSVSRVLSEGERLLSGWTLLAPDEFNTKTGNKFEEKILLVSAQAIYIIRYDYTLEKVRSYRRIPLGDIVGISKGAYILSPLEEASRDPKQNAGFVITWLNCNQTIRVTSYSLRNTADALAPLLPTTEEPEQTSPPASPFAPLRQFSVGNGNISRKKRKSTTLSDVLSHATWTNRGDTTFAAFKILPIDPTRLRRGSSFGGGDSYAEPADELSDASSCQEAVDRIVETIQRACDDAGSNHENFVTEADVVNLEEAQKMTSVYAKMEYGLKRLLWLGG
ncbi:hypothetical protein FISHEDRAFT_53223 [Fistulina hepatica ATCC 64428]|nr:hypothetical protein FISHEDRAFT_53223 [Fistulina hepatica ATCC 64428]